MQLKPNAIAKELHKVRPKVTCIPVSINQPNHPDGQAQLVVAATVGSIKYCSCSEISLKLSALKH